MAEDTEEVQEHVPDEAETETEAEPETPDAPEEPQRPGRGARFVAGLRRFFEPRLIRLAAAVVAGALSLADGVKVICRRSNLMLKVSGSGAMASVELPAQQVLSELGARGVSDVVLAVVASPQSTVVGSVTLNVSSTGTSILVALALRVAR